MSTLQSRTVVVQFPLAINSQSDGVAFLVAEQHPGGIRIRRSSRYGGKLNRFWTVWLRDVLLKAPDKYQLTITTSKLDVYVTTPVPITNWIWAICNLAAAVVPVPDPPMMRGRDFCGRIHWQVHEKADLTDIVRGVKLPVAASRHFCLAGGYDSVWLRTSGTNRRRCAISPHEVAKIVEMQIAFACMQGYRIIPPNDPRNPYYWLEAMQRKAAPPTTVRANAQYL